MRATTEAPSRTLGRHWGVTRRSRTARRAPGLERSARFGGTEGNEILTSATAVVLVVLLVAEGVTILNMRGSAALALSLLPAISAWHGGH